MRAVRIISKTVGLLQAIIGGMSLIFAFLLFYDFFNVQAAFGLSGDSIELYMLVFVVFGLFSVISGLLLFYE
ncbi:MAG: hypothetical protein ACPLRY_04990 [Candidatus Bathyarchaeales archaeon]